MHSPNCRIYWGINRRLFLRALIPGAIASILQSVQPARAENTATALVLSCIDFRFLEAERSFLALQNLTNHYDWTALAGASLALNNFPQSADTTTFWDQLDLSYQLHHIKKVVIIDHQDCGAYARQIDPLLSQNSDRERQVHRYYLSQAYWTIGDRYPINVELYFVTLNGRVEPILPMAQSDRTLKEKID